MELSRLALLTMVIALYVIPVCVSQNSFESTPAHINGQLVACVGDQILMTCSRVTDLSSGITLWNISSPVNCTVIIQHVTSTIGSCSPFMFQNVSVVQGNPILSSTAVTTANTSISGAVVRCQTSSVPLLSNQIGPSITICIPDRQPPPENIRVLLMADGIVEISWNPPPIVCTVSSISYNINLTRTDGDPMEERAVWPNATTETAVTLNLTAGQQYRILIAAVNIDCSILSNEVERVFTASSSAVTTQSPATSPTTFEVTTERGGASTALPQSTVAIIVVVIAVAILILTITIVVALWYFFCRRPKALHEHARSTDTNVELKSSEGDALVYDDPNPKVVPHTEAASGDLYAQPEKRSTEPQGVYQDPNSIKHEQAPTGDFYALPQPQQTGKKKGKSQGSSVDQENANIAAMYSTVDTSKKNQLTYAHIDVGSGSGSGGKPLPQSTPYATLVT